MGVLEIAKQEVKIVSLLSGDRERVNGGYMYEVCPCCDHKKHFVVWDNNCFTAFGCGYKGTIVDFISIKESCDTPTAIKKVLQLSGLEGEKISYKEMKRLKAESEEKKLKMEKEDKIVDKFYNAITKMYKATMLIKMDDRDAFINWVSNYMDRYSNLIIIAKNHQERIRIVRQFRSHYDYEYKAFCKMEYDLNRMMTTPITLKDMETEKFNKELSKKINKNMEAKDNEKA